MQLRPVEAQVAPRRVPAVVVSVVLVLAGMAVLWNAPRVPRYIGLHLLVALLWMIVGARRFPRVVTVTFLTAAVVNAFGWAYRWLDTVWMYDELAHTLVTFALTLPATMVLNQNQSLSARRVEMTFLFATIGIGLLGGFAWEVIEWISDHYVPDPGHMSLTDTIKDMTSNLLGATLAARLAHGLLLRDQFLRSRR